MQRSFSLFKHHRSRVEEMTDGDGEHDVVECSHRKAKIDRPLELDDSLRVREAMRIKTYTDMLDLRK